MNLGMQGLNSCKRAADVLGPTFAKPFQEISDVPSRQDGAVRPFVATSGLPGGRGGHCILQSKRAHAILGCLGLGFRWWDACFLCSHGRHCRGAAVR